MKGLLSELDYFEPNVINSVLLLSMTEYLKLEKHSFRVGQFSSFSLELIGFL